MLPEYNLNSHCLEKLSVKRLNLSLFHHIIWCDPVRFRTWMLTPCVGQHMSPLWHPGPVHCDPQSPSHWNHVQSVRSETLSALRPGGHRTPRLRKNHLLPRNAGVPDSLGTQGGCGEHGSSQWRTTVLLWGRYLRAGHSWRCHGGVEAWAQWWAPLQYGVCWGKSGLVREQAETAQWLLLLVWLSWTSGALHPPEFSEEYILSVGQVEFQGELFKQSSMGMKEKLTQQWQFSHCLLTSCGWKVGWSFLVHKDFLQRLQ